MPWIRLWTTLAAVGLVGLLLGWLREAWFLDVFNVFEAHPLVAPLAWCTCSALMARLCERPVCQRQARACVSILATFGLAASLYLIWAHNRACHAIRFDSNYPEGWPYPDRLINGFDRWFEGASNGPRPFLRAHDQPPKLLASLNGLIATTTGLAGASLGLLFTPRIRRKSRGSG
jgi:hypothetical protein